MKLSLMFLFSKAKQNKPNFDKKKSESNQQKIELNVHQKIKSSRSSTYRSSRNTSSTDFADLHPLNLPPEERERRRSALLDMADGLTSMESTGKNLHDASSPSSPPFTPSSLPSQSGVTQTPESDSHSNPVPPRHGTPSIDAEAYKAAGNKFFRMQDYGKAIQEYSKALEADPRNPTYLSNRSAALMSANLFKRAFDDAKLSDELEPGNTKVLLRLARICTALGRPEEAMTIYERIQPPVTIKDKAPAKAMENFVFQAEEALREGTTGSMILHSLEQAERGLGHGVDRPRKWKLLRGEAYLRIGSVNALGEAQNVAMSLLRGNAQDPEALVLRGRAMYAQGESDKALQHFRQALNCDPDFKDAIKYLRLVQKLDKMKEQGNNAFKSGRFEEAVQVYGAALEIDPLNKSTNSKILQNRAMASIKV